MQKSVSCQRSFAAAVGVEESSLTVKNEERSRKPTISEEMKTKASDQDMLTE